jgi:hypothetical protein
MCTGYILNASLGVYMHRNVSPTYIQTGTYSPGLEYTTHKYVISKYPPPFLFSDYAVSE